MECFYLLGHIFIVSCERNYIILICIISKGTTSSSGVKPFSWKDGTKVMPHHFMIFLVILTWWTRINCTSPPSYSRLRGRFWWGSYRYLNTLCLQSYSNSFQGREDIIPFVPFCWSSILCFGMSWNIVPFEKLMNTIVITFLIYSLPYEKVNTPVSLKFKLMWIILETCIFFT